MYGKLLPIMTWMSSALKENSRCVSSRYIGSQLSDLPLGLHNTTGIGKAVNKPTEHSVFK